MVGWSRAFGAPVLLHVGDRQWAVRQEEGVTFWEGDARDVAPGVRLVHCGGHFEGSTILHWERGADGRGVLLTGDTIQVVPDNRCVSFMRSFPNQKAARISRLC